MNLRFDDRAVEQAVREHLGKQSNLIHDERMADLLLAYAWLFSRQQMARRE